MFAAALISLLAVAPPTGFTASFERVGLVRFGDKAPTVTVDEIGGSITLTNLKLPGRLVSEVCPTAEVKKGALVLTCVTRRIWAGLYEDKRGIYLDLRQLRGVPWEGETALPLHAWPLRAAGIPDECPGRLDATIGECLLEAKKYDEAEAAYRRGRSGPDANFCYLRLGDLAVMRGDPEAAVNLYAFIPPVGPVGRIARVRLCDLTGACMNEKASAQVADTFAMPEPLKSELQMMSWRREVFMGREAKIMPAFAQELQDHPTLCLDAVPLCQRMLIAGLTVNDDDSRAAALQGWLVENVRRGPYQLALALAAAHAAEDLGAPSFAANVLASTTVPNELLGPHLLRVVELYLSSRDYVRANVILEYAENKLGKPNTSGKGWAVARRRIELLAHPPAPKPPPTPAVESPSISELSTNVDLARELARSASLRSRAKEPDHAP
jgi:hypothetical protein